MVITTTPAAVGTEAAQGACVLLKFTSHLLFRVLTSPSSPLDDTIQSHGFQHHPHLTCIITLDSARISELTSSLGNRHYKCNPAQNELLTFNLHSNKYHHPPSCSGQKPGSLPGDLPFPHSSPAVHKIVETQPLLASLVHASSSPRF